MPEVIDIVTSDLVEILIWCFVVFIFIGLMCLDTVRIIEWGTLGTYTVVVNIYVNVYGLEMKVGKLERKLGEDSLTQSITSVLITAPHYFLGLVCTVGIKLQHR